MINQIETIIKESILVKNEILEEFYEVLSDIPEMSQWPQSFSKTNQEDEIESILVVLNKIFKESKLI